MMANELDPSTLEPVTPAFAPASNTGLGATATLPGIWDLVASVESAYWKRQFTANADLPARKLDSTAISSDETALGLLRPSSMVCFIQVNAWTPCALLIAGLPLASTNDPPLPKSSTAKSQVTP